MSHEIAVTETGEAMMAYQGEMPWHKLGTSMENADVADALAAANLNWKVLLRPTYFRQGKSLVKIPQCQAVVRDTDQQLLATVGSDYSPLQNAEAFSVLQPACERHGVTIESAGALGVGDRVWMLARLPEQTEVVQGDALRGYFLVMSGHNGWTSWTARPTPVRVVCNNTLAVALEGNKESFKLRHVASETAKIDQMTKMITRIIEQLVHSTKAFGKLAARHMTPDELFLYVSQVLNIDNVDASQVQPVSARRRETIIDLAAHGKGVQFAPGTAWTAYNAVTEYTDHVRPAEAHNPRTITQANQSAVFGSNAKLKSKALNLALALVD